MTDSSDGGTAQEKVPGRMGVNERHSLHTEDVRGLLGSAYVQCRRIYSGFPTIGAYDLDRLANAMLEATIVTLGDDEDGNGPESALRFLERS